MQKIPIASRTDLHASTKFNSIYVLSNGHEWPVDRIDLPTAGHPYLHQFNFNSIHRSFLIALPYSKSITGGLCTALVKLKYRSLQLHQFETNFRPILYELIQTEPLAISPQLFHSKLKTLLFNKSYPESSSSPYLPPRLNSKHHPP